VRIWFQSLLSNGSTRTGYSLALDPAALVRALHANRITRVMLTPVGLC
jgi:hypothetical protein